MTIKDGWHWRWSDLCWGWKDCNFIPQVIASCFPSVWLWWWMSYSKHIFGMGPTNIWCTILAYTYQGLQTNGTLSQGIHKNSLGVKDQTLCGDNYLVGGFKHGFYCPSMSIIYGMSSFPLTNSYVSRWLSHHQPAINNHPRLPESHSRRGKLLNPEAYPHLSGKAQFKQSMTPRAAPGLHVGPWPTDVDLPYMMYHDISYLQCVYIYIHICYILYTDT
jgi:hypothetical protein